MSNAPFRVRWSRSQRNGAEAFEYRRDDEPEPRNARLLSQEEVWRVKGWAAIRDVWKARGCDDHTTVHNDGRFNSNTAAAPVLETAGLTPDAAQAMVQGRREGFEAVPGALTAAAITSDPFGNSSGSSGGTLRISHRLASVEWQLGYELELTPSRDGGPWRMHEIRYRRRPPPEGPDLTRLPAPDFELQDSERPAPDALSTPAFAN